ncbi:hypothetical protein [Streptomyces sp. NPDC093109]|uniref:hypothetical protein n=1 Tax=Streptomyces sp. NPDC093109 TaxID=3154977 RepID=UPI003450C645
MAPRQNSSIRSPSAAPVRERLQRAVLDDLPVQRRRTHELYGRPDRAEVEARRRRQ